MREQLVVVAVDVLDAQVLRRPCALVRVRTAGGDDLRTRHAEGEVLRVALAQAAETDDADFRVRGGHL